MGQWLVVDADVALLLDQFSRRRQIRDVIHEVACRSKTSPEATAAEVTPVIEALLERRNLEPVARRRAARQDPLRIASLTFNITNRCNLRCPWCYNRCEEEAQVPIADLIAWIRAGARRGR